MPDEVSNRSRLLVMFQDLTLCARLDAMVTKTNHQGVGSVFAGGEAIRDNRHFRKPLNYYNYFTEIEDAFIRRRGKNLLLSPLDWALIEGWQDRAIPLHIVLRAIESVFDGFDKQPNQNRTIKSLFYCREEVEAQFAEWTAAQVGSHTNGPGKLLSADTENALSREAVVEYIRKAADSLTANPDEHLREDL